MMKVIIYYLLGPFVFILGTIVLFLVINIVAPIIGCAPPTIGSIGTSMYAFFASAIPLLFGLLIARVIVSTYSRKAKLSIKPLLRRKWIAGLLIGAYLLTWTVGGPAVQSANTKWAIEMYNRTIKSTALGGWNSTSYIRTYVTFPILPFILISYHEYQFAPLFGGGGWFIHYWFLKDAKCIFIFPTWIS